MEEKAKKITEGFQISEDLFLETKKAVFSVENLSDKLKEISSENLSKILELVLAGGIVLNSSDIHIEAEEDGAKLRARIDGVLQDITLFNLKTHQALVSRIKLLSGVKLNIVQKSQDGRFSVSFPETEIKNKIETIVKNSFKVIDIRTSTLPSEYGETIVLRILNPDNLSDFESLGLRQAIKEKLEKEIKKPNGMIVVTGPTGSGKTTTLYAVLKKIKNPGIKIITIEDPVEYHLDGISQTEVHQEKGYDFANGLKSIVRQDPDVILVGEIRDLETVQIALQAALTGHLVLTTLHTNDASGAITRLQSLGEQLHNIAPAINLVVAQRLVRKVCSCAKQEILSQEEFQKISEKISQEMFFFSKETEILHPVGCPRCNNTGYKGRVGVFEVFLVDDEMENFILSNPSSVDLKKKAIEKGMTTMYQDGLIKVLEKETTLEELERVVVE
jgi:general secretion pathway protein E